MKVSQALLLLLGVVALLSVSVSALNRRHANRLQLNADVDLAGASDSELEAELDAEVELVVNAETELDASASAEAQMMANSAARMESLASLGAELKFETIEHKRLGDALKLDMPSALDTLTPYDGKLTNHYRRAVSYGDIIAAAGDFYGVPAKLNINYRTLKAGQEVICWGKTPADRRVRFIRNFESFWNANVYDGRKLSNVKSGDGLDVVLQYFKTEESVLAYDKVKSPALDIPNMDAAQIKQLKQRLDAINAEQTAATDGPLAAQRKASLKLNEVPEVKDTAALLKKFGFALRLLNVNVDHFNGDYCSLNAYTAGHQVAMRYAARAGLSTNLADQKKYWNLALSMNAFADHFLTDAFCSGHARGHRGLLMEKCNRDGSNMIQKVVSPLLTAGLAANLAHDMDNTNGLELISRVDHLYVKSLNLTGRERDIAFYKRAMTAYGDFRLFDGPSMTQAGTVVSIKIDPRAQPGGFKVATVSSQLQYNRIMAAVQASYDELKWAFNEAINYRKQGKLKPAEALDMMVRIAPAGNYHAPHATLSAQVIPFYYARNTCPLYSVLDKFGNELTGSAGVLRDAASVRRLVDRKGLTFWSNPISPDCLTLAHSPDSWRTAPEALYKRCEQESSYKARCQYVEFTPEDCPSARYEPDFKRPVTVAVPGTSITRRFVNFKPANDVKPLSATLATAFNGVLGQVKVEDRNLDWIFSLGKEDERLEI